MKYMRFMICNERKERHMFNEITKLQREIYNLMFKKGWYEIEKAEENKITQKLNMLEGCMPELDK